MYDYTRANAFLSSIYNDDYLEGFLYQYNEVKKKPTEKEIRFEIFKCFLDRSIILKEFELNYIIEEIRRNNLISM